MLPRSAFLDMANADDFHTALDMLSGSDYADMQSAATLGEAENMLLAKRRMVRNLFIDLMIDEDIAAVLRTRHDFANMRLAIRRVVTEKAIGLDYSDFGNVAVEDLEEISRRKITSSAPLSARSGRRSGPVVLCGQEHSPHRLRD